MPLDPEFPGDALGAALFRTMAETARDYVSCVDRDGRILYLSRLRSREARNVLGCRFDDFLAEPNRQPVMDCLAEVFATERPQELEYEAVLGDGGLIRLHARFLPVRSPSGEQLVLVLSTDVTELRRLELEAERSIEFRRRVVEHLPDFVSMVDREHRFVWANRYAPGLSPETVLGKNIALFQAPEQLQVTRAAIEAAFEKRAVGQYEGEGYRDRTSRSWYLVRVVPIVLDDKVDNVLLITSDITERKRAELALRQTEEHLHRAQRLESVGQLAGGIAHDFNNLLQVIAGNLSFAKESLRKGGMPTEELTQALLATERAAELTSHLLAIGRRGRVAPRRIELGALVESSVRMLRRAIPESISLRYVAPAEPCVVELDAPQFEQVLINLCVNARDAMPAGGTITIRIEPGGTEHVSVSVADTGTGISPENLPRIFEPFFTTKAAGSGLGLAVAAGIVSAHGGTIVAESDGKSGTVVRMRLGRVASSAESFPPPAPVPSSGAGVILVAEDEERVRAILVRILEKAGYTVLQAPNGARALELFREHRGTIRLVILDVVMPELDGWRAYTEIEKLAPGTKVLFTTGYAANVLPQDFAARGARLLEKPYSPAHLLSRVSELLDQPPEPV